MEAADPGLETAIAVAPDRYEGDWSSLDGGNGVVRLSIKLLIGGTPIRGGLVRIVGCGNVAAHEFPTPTNSRVWNTFEVPIDEASWTVESGTWADLISNVTEFRVFAELVWGCGAEQRAVRPDADRPGTDVPRGNLKFPLTGAAVYRPAGR
jgi:hypothetical protein